MAKKEKPTPKREVTKRRLARWQRERRRRRIIITSGTLVIALVLAIIGYGFYATGISPKSELVATVGGTDLTSTDYETVVRLSPAARNSSEVAFTQLVNSELIEQGAHEFGIEVTHDETMKAIRDSFAAEGEGNLTDKRFEELYDETVSYLGVSKEQFEDNVADQLLSLKIEEQEKGDVPELGEVIPQVHLEAIMVATEMEAEIVMGNLSRGADFATLAAKYGGGDMGWLPRGMLDLDMEDFAFSAVTANVTDYFSTNQGYFIVRVMDTVEDRPLADELVRQQLLDSAYGYWLELEWKQKVTWEVDKEKLAEIYAWALEKIG